VWKSKTRWHLFVDLDPASIGRLIQPCGNQEEFNWHCCIKRSHDHPAGGSLVCVRSVTALPAIRGLSWPRDGRRVNVGSKIYGAMIT
jgi:hypothetical protein